MNNPKDQIQIYQAVPTLTAAVEASFNIAGLSPKEAAFLLGIEYSHFTRMFNPNDSRHFPPDLIETAMIKFRNNFPLEWLAWKRGMVVYPKNFMAILDGIKESLEREGHPVRFALQQLNQK